MAHLHPGRDALAAARRPSHARQIAVRPRLARWSHVVAVASAETAVAQVAEDKWIARTLSALSGTSVPSSLQALHGSSVDALHTLRMPTTRNEEFRFTDISPLLKSTIQAASGTAHIDAQLLSSLALSEAAATLAVLVDGVLRPELSQLSGVPTGVYVGSIQGAPAQAAAKLGALTHSRGGPFSVLNGAAVRDVLAVVVPAGVVMEAPLHVLYLSTGGSETQRNGSAPRLLLHAGANSAVEVLEEFTTGGTSGQYFTCGVSEMFLAEHAQVKHGYVQREAQQAIHVKSSLVQQAASSQYTLTEASIGAGLSRHDVGVEQAGAETETHMRHFLVCGSAQLHDLHSKLELNHPRGVAEQLHKCIVAHSSGRGVFDGNVKVNKLAQQSDAKQLSRNLLLVPLATVNVKPNLQIIADDVKCTHGCTVSDLQDEELFYFRARGIDADTARRALVSSFGAEVTQKLKYKQLLQRVKADVTKTLAVADISAATSA